jgi:hypothetical protein
MNVPPRGFSDNGALPVIRIGLLMTHLTRWKEKDHRMTRMNANLLREMTYSRILASIR